MNEICVVVVVWAEKLKTFLIQAIEQRMLLNGVNKDN
jgi:hypothetical protein